MRSADNLLGADGRSEENEAANFTDVTILAVYKSTIVSNQNRAADIGTSLHAGSGGQNMDNFHLAHDPSIRKDNGSINAGTYSQPAPTEFFIRVSTMTTGSVVEYFDGIEVMTNSASYPLAVTTSTWAICALPTLATSTWRR